MPFSALKLRNRHFFLLDLLALSAIPVLALTLHADGLEWWSQASQALLFYTLVSVLVKMSVFYRMGLYRRYWRYAGVNDFSLVLISVVLSTVILAVLFIGLYPLLRPYGWAIYRTVPMLDGLLTGVVVGCVRFFLRGLYRWPWRRQKNTAGAQRVLIVGVSHLARQLATQLHVRCNRTTTYEVVGVVDGDPNCQGMRIDGIEVLGTTEQIPALVAERQIDIIVIAQRPENPEEMWKLIATCQETPAQVKVLPDMVEVVAGCYEDPLALRDVSVEDILGRVPATIDTESCRRILAGKTVLVTGAAGSIGSELCRQILRFEPKALLALDNNETGLYELNLELNHDRCSPLQLIMADVSNWRETDWVFQQYYPQVVFHAAAYKHVPMLEGFPNEALRVNVMGTVITSEIAHRYRAERFVFISTDKAVKPSSVMGASKRVGETWLKSLSEQSDTTFTSVRFGNVVGSRGSVLPTFARQIELGGPVTVTHPGMRRFFMSIPEAVRLVLQAAAFGQGGDIFMLEMGDEISILDLAERMIRLKGLRVDRDIKIKFIGIRPGEKLREALSYAQESREETPHPNLYRLRSSDSSVDCETLLGVISILMHIPHVAEHEKQVAYEGLFQIAACNIDGFLNRIAGTDLMRNWRQLADSATTREKVEKDSLLSLTHKTCITEGTLLASDV